MTSPQNRRCREIDQSIGCRAMRKRPGQATLAYRFGRSWPLTWFRRPVSQCRVPAASRTRTRMTRVAGRFINTGLVTAIEPNQPEPTHEARLRHTKPDENLTLRRSTEGRPFSRKLGDFLCLIRPGAPCGLTALFKLPSSTHAVVGLGCTAKQSAPLPSLSRIQWSCVGHSWSLSVAVEIGSVIKLWP